jgi:tRNA G26 N,N-dimethylase Trm1
MLLLKVGFYFTANPYDVLPCNCHLSHPGKTALELGPLWSGALFDTNFLRLMLAQEQLTWITDTKEILEKMLEEALCPDVIKIPDVVQQADEPAKKKPKVTLVSRYDIVMVATISSITTLVLILIKT